MNKGELVDEILKSEHFKSRNEAERALSTVLDGIGCGLERDGKVQLMGFGTFTVKNYAARTGINPATREPIQIAARTSVGFKPGQGLKSRV